MVLAGCLLYGACGCCQFPETVLCFVLSINRDFMMPRLGQFIEILWCSVWVNLQRFYGAPFESIYRDFMVLRLGQFIEIL